MNNLKFRLLMFFTFFIKPKN